MKHLNRVLGGLLAVALGAAAVLVIIEVVAHLVGSAPVVLPWDRASSWASTAMWSATPILIGAVIALVVGLVLLIAEIKRAKVARLAVTSATPAVNTGYTRRGVAVAARAAAERVDGVADAVVSVTRSTVKVTATSAAHSTDTARQLAQPVTTSVQQQLDRLQLQNPLRVSVTTRARRS